MITIEQHLCKSMHRFVKAHLDEVKETPESLGFKSYKDMLSQIKNDWEVAFWAMTELCAWGMKENYLHLFTAYECDDFVVYCIGAKKVRYIKVNFTDYGNNLVEVSPKVKMVKTLVWEAN